MFSIFICLCYARCHTQWAWVTYAFKPVTHVVGSTTHKFDDINQWLLLIEILTLLHYVLMKPPFVLSIDCATEWSDLRENVSESDLLTSYYIIRLKFLSFGWNNVTLTFLVLFLHRNDHPEISIESVVNHIKFNIHPVCYIIPNCRPSALEGRNYKRAGSPHKIFFKVFKNFKKMFDLQYSESLNFLQLFSNLSLTFWYANCVSMIFDVAMVPTNFHASLEKKLLLDIIFYLIFLSSPHLTAEILAFFIS